jgi:hypothetical protein
VAVDIMGVFVFTVPCVVAIAGHRSLGYSVKDYSKSQALKMYGLRKVQDTQK